VSSSLPAPVAEPEPEPEAALDIPRPRFIVDSMMGRLLRWMRVIGVDAEAAPPAAAAAAEGGYHASVIARANAGARVLLTRDRKLLMRKEAVCAFWVTANETREQFDEVCSHFRISVRPEDLMSRCSRCNGLGYEHMTSEQVAAALAERPERFDVPAKVLRKIGDFWRCGRCDKL